MALVFWIAVFLFLIGASCRSQGVRRHVDGASQTTNGAPEQPPHEADGEKHVESSSAIPLDEEPGQYTILLLNFVWRTLQSHNAHLNIPPEAAPNTNPCTDNVGVCLEEFASARSQSIAA